MVEEVKPMQRLDTETLKTQLQNLCDIVVFDTIPSTNSYLRERVQNENLGCTLVLAEEQTSGRGRLGRSFHSPRASGIYMSLLLPLDNTIDPQKLTVCTGVALLDTLKMCCPTISPLIKWVNDIYIKDKKVAGILVEGVYRPDGVFCAIVGIGINIKETAFPEELSRIATSLQEHLGECPERTALICALVRSFFSCLREDFSCVLSRYKEHSYLIGREVFVMPHGADIYEAKAVDIDENGALVVLLNNGEYRTLSSGDVSVRQIKQEKDK